MSEPTPISPPHVRQEDYLKFLSENPNLDEVERWYAFYQSESAKRARSYDPAERLINPASQILRELKVARESLEKALSQIQTVHSNYSVDFRDQFPETDARGRFILSLMDETKAFKTYPFSPLAYALKSLNIKIQEIEDATPLLLQEITGSPNFSDDI